jgi:hypothetical protein
LNEITIRTEKEAFALLEKALDQKLGDKLIALKFDRWPLIEIKVEGEGYESTITPDMASALIDIQHAINRAYARAAHNTSNARSLTAEERNGLQFKAKVESGSSLITVDLGKFAEKLATSVADKMTPESLVITIIGLAIAGGSLLAYKAFLKTKIQHKVIEQDALTKIALSQEETKRLEVFGRALAKEPTLVSARDDFDAARNEVVRSAGDATKLTFNSVEIDGATAKVVGIAKRTESQEVQLNGTYLVIATDLRKPDEIKLRVKSKANGREFSASFMDHSLQQDQIKLIQAAEWDRTEVYLSINASTLRGDITSATVISVKPQPHAA